MINQISCGNIAIKFKRIHCTVTKTGPCQICGKTSKRTRTFEEHVSFFNCNEDGSQKTADEIKAESKSNQKTGRMNLFSIKSV